MIARFVLIQFDRIHGVNECLSGLPWCMFNLDYDWKIAIGTINEFGVPEIVSIAAEAYPVWDEDHWLVTSQFDKPSTIVPKGRRASMMGLIRGRLSRIYRGGVYGGDLCNLPQPVIARGICTKAVSPEEVH